ncbi:MAG: hypothetical protein KJO98_01265 [Rhodothermia bacterium]|nr:hypothetical protein [Rhodothermia bacterium]
MPKLLFVLVFLLPAIESVAQSRLLDRSPDVDTLRVTDDRVLRLKPFLVPESVRVFQQGTRIDSTKYEVGARFGVLMLGASFVPGDTVVVSYEALPFTFEDTYRAVPQVIGNQASVLTGPRRTASERDFAGESAGSIFGSSRLRKSGSITRGVIAGNNQDATIESGLRMQLSGEIVDGVNLRAVLTDENTPILPEGTTQRINEFDRVFIEVSSRRGTAQLGDFDLAVTGPEFAQFNRKLQGAKVEGLLPTAHRFYRGGSVTAAGATSRGTFRSQEINGLEGVQGPYRLEGQFGERFIIVVPGTEVVYIDGRRTTRGETNDYTIDYATAEITFTPRQIITANKRITVEFQYSTNQFTRTLVAASVTSRFGPSNRDAGRLSLTVIREADGKDFNEEFGLTSTDSLLLAESGDGVAARSGAELVGYDPEASFVQYIRQPRPFSDVTDDSIFVALNAEPNPGTPVFRVQFSRVQPGAGSYVRSGRSVNGILYEFAGPGMGDYEPIRVLPKPRLQQVVDLRGEVEPVAGLQLFGEWASSTDNQNRLSSLDTSDDDGHAYTVGLRAPPLSIGLGGAAVAAEFRRRFVHEHFRSFNRIREVEFGRKWNLDGRSAGVAGGNSLGVAETTDEAAVEARFNSRSFLRGEWGSFSLGSNFHAIRRKGIAEFGTEEGGSLKYSSEYVTSTDRGLDRRGKWLRQLGSVRYTNLLGPITPSVEVEHEDRRQRDLTADSLTGASLAFVEVRPALTYALQHLELGSSADIRSERFVLDGRLQDAATGWTIRGFFTYRSGLKFSTDGNVGVRRRRFRDRFRISQGRQNSESVVMRWKGSYRPFKRAVDASWFYEAQTERTPKLQEIYVRTGPELGQFVWTDFNGDGAIQIDEFIPETTPNEGNYVKTFVPSDSLFSIIGVQARLRVAIDPGKVWSRDLGGVKRILGQVSTRTTLEVLEKSQRQELKDIYLLRLRNFRKPGSTLNGRLLIRQEVSLFKRRTDYGFDFAFSQVRNLTDLAAGLEERFINSVQLSGRYRPVRTVAASLTVTTDINRTESANFASRQFDLKTLRVVPDVTYSPNRSWQVKIGADIADKKDRRFERSARIIKLPVEVRHNRARKLQVTGRVEVADVTLQGEADGFAQFELTDGRGAGRSFLWSASARYAINQFIRATLSYDGRSPAAAPTLHTVRMQVSAIF